MSETNESIDRESPDNEERTDGNYYKDKDFNIEDYQDDIESDESFDFEGSNKNRPVKTIVFIIFAVLRLSSTRFFDCYCLFTMLLFCFSLKRKFSLFI